MTWFTSSFVTEMASCESDPKESGNQDEKSDNSILKLPELPAEITVEILARLSVKALLRFRCVCKSWHFLICNPNFVKKHLRLSITDENYSHHRAIITTVDPDFSFRYCSLNSIYNNNEPSHDELEFPLKDPQRRGDRVVGSCNGLLCIQIERPQVVLWNPSTRQFNILLKLGRGFDDLRYRVLYGFGYDKSVDDYKVVAVYRTSRGFKSRNSKNRLDVFTLRTNSWRKIGNFPNDYFPSEAIFVSGYLHWNVIGDSTSFIVSFDLATETYSEVPQPDFSSGWHPSLGVLGGSLCIACSYHVIFTDIWVMRECGVKESWTRLFTIPFPVGTSIYQYMKSPKPLCFAKNGDLLLYNDSQLLLYNPKDNTFRSIAIHGFPACLTTDIYVESLVSPSACNQLGDNANN